MGVAAIVLFTILAFAIKGTKPVNSSGDIAAADTGAADTGQADTGSQSNDSTGQQNNQQGARQLAESSVLVADKALRCLVRISVTRGANVPNDKEMESYFGQLPTAKGTDIGSGFFIQPGGWILTFWARFWLLLR